MRSRSLIFALLAACSSTAHAPRVVPTRPSTASTPLALRFAVIGDWGAATADEAAIAERLCAIKASKPFRYLVTTGDNFYHPDGRATEANFTKPTTCLRAAGIEWRATWGNHDIAGDSTGAVLGARQHYYTWTASGVEFFMLDSNNVNTAQTSWLRGRLRDSRARVKIAVFHHPPYTAGLHAPNKAIQAAWVPLFDKFHVTLVLSGHNHGYEHSIVRGVDYVVSGGGGAENYACLGFPSYLITCKSVHHALMIEVTGGAVSVEATGEDGKVLDRFTVRAV